MTLQSTRRQPLVWLASLFLLLGPLASLANDDADVRGTWATTVTMPQGEPGHPTFVLDQTGAAISGTYRGALGEREVNGTIRGDAVDIRFVVTGRGDVNGPVVYNGTLEGDTIRGTVTIANAVQGSFVAERLAVDE